MRSCALFLLALLGASRAQQPGAQQLNTQELVSRVCLGCICEASTQCDVNRGCANGVCGPFLISRPFFIDSELGREPAYAGQTFESCAADVFCSAAIIRKYMVKYPYDCDKDGRLSCTDRAMVHKAGPGGCQANSSHVKRTVYWQRLVACLAHYPGV